MMIESGRSSLCVNRAGAYVPRGKRAKMGQNRLFQNILI